MFVSLFIVLINCKQFNVSELLLHLIWFCCDLEQNVFKTLPNGSFKMMTMKYTGFFDKETSATLHILLMLFYKVTIIIPLFFFYSGFILPHLLCNTLHLKYFPICAKHISLPGVM